MRLFDVYPYLLSGLQEEFKTLAMKYKDFPFHIRVKGRSEHRDWVEVTWSLDERGEDEVSRLSGTVKGPFEGTFLIEVQAKRNKSSPYPGEEIQERSWLDDRPQWYKADWRQERFLTELSARALWPLLECHADWDKVVKDVLTR